MGRVNYNSKGEVMKWDDVLDALRTTHTIGTKRICESLKVSRTWVNKYISPHVHSIYISNGIVAEKTVSVRWTKIAEKEIGRELKETTWYHEQEFLDLLSQHITISKQMKKIPIEILYKDPDGYKSKRELLLNEYKIENRKKDSDKKKLKQLQLELIKLAEESFNDGGKKLLADGLVEITKRKEAEPVSVEVPEGFVRETLEYWTTPHSEKNYGDSDEKVHRKFFREGYLKMVLELPDADGVVGKKVFYMRDLEELEVKTEKYITVKESAYRKLKDELNQEWLKNQIKKQRFNRKSEDTEGEEKEILIRLLPEIRERTAYENYCSETGREPLENIRDYVRACIKKI